MSGKTKIVAAQLLICLVVAGTWELAGRMSTSVFFFLGTPSAIVIEFYKLITNDNLAKHFGVTGSEALVGLLIGTIIGAGGGLALWYSEAAAAIARPFIIALGTLPIFAFAPLMIVWFGIGFGMKVALAAFSTVFIAFNQGYKGATLVSRDYIDVLAGMNASRHQIFFKVVVPASLDWVLSSMRLNVGFGLLGAFIGEFVASDKGLGYLILRAGSLYNIPRALAAAIGITVLALILDYGARYVENVRNAVVQVLSVPIAAWHR